MSLVGPWCSSSNASCLPERRPSSMSSVSSLSASAPSTSSRWPNTPPSREIASPLEVSTTEPGAAAAAASLTAEEAAHMRAAELAAPANAHFFYPSSSSASSSSSSSASAPASSSSFPDSPVSARIGKPPKLPEPSNFTITIASSSPTPSFGPAGSPSFQLQGNVASLTPSFSSNDGSSIHNKRGQDSDKTQAHESATSPQQQQQQQQQQQHVAGDDKALDAIRAQLLSAEDAIRSIQLTVCQAIHRTETLIQESEWNVEKEWQTLLDRSREEAALQQPQHLQEALDAAAEQLGSDRFVRDRKLNSHDESRTLGNRYGCQHDGAETVNGGDQRRRGLPLHCDRLLLEPLSISSAQARAERPGLTVTPDSFGHDGFKLEIRPSISVVHQPEVSGQQPATSTSTSTPGIGTTSVSGHGSIPLLSRKAESNETAYSSFFPLVDSLLPRDQQQEQLPQPQIHPLPMPKCLPKPPSMATSASASLEVSEAPSNDFGQGSFCFTSPQLQPQQQQQQQQQQSDSEECTPEGPPQQQQQQQQSSSQTSPSPWPELSSILKHFESGDDEDDRLDDLEGSVLDDDDMSATHLGAIDQFLAKVDKSGSSVGSSVCRELSFGDVHDDEQSMCVQRRVLPAESLSPPLPTFVAISTQRTSPHYIARAGDLVDQAMAKFLNQPSNRFRRSLVSRWAQGEYLVGTLEVHVALDISSGELLVKLAARLDAQSGHCPWIFLEDFFRLLENRRPSRRDRKR